MISTGIYTLENTLKSCKLLLTGTPYVSKVCIGNHTIHSRRRNVSISSYIAHSLAMHATGIYSGTYLTQWHNYTFCPPLCPLATIGFMAQSKLGECLDSHPLQQSIKILCLNGLAAQPCHMIKFSCLAPSPFGRCL